MRGKSSNKRGGFFLFADKLYVVNDGRRSIVCYCTFMANLAAKDHVVDDHSEARFRLISKQNQSQLDLYLKYKIAAD